MDLRQYLTVFRKWWWLMLLSTAIAAFGSWYVVKDQPLLYQTSTTLMIGQVIDKPDPTYADFYTIERLAQTYAEMIKREPILRAAAKALNPEFEDQWRSLRSQVGVNLVPGTQLIEIRVTDTNPQSAKAIADELAGQLKKRVTPKITDEREFIESQKASFPDKIKAAQTEIQKLEEELGQTFSARQIQELQNQINSLQSQINTWQMAYAQYEMLLGSNGVKVLDIIEEAAVPTVPIGPNRMMQVLLAAAIGLILAVGAAFLIEALDDTLKSPDDITKTMGLSILGAITRITGETPAERLITVRHPKSPISEAYRVIRTNLQFSSLDKPLRTLVVTSPNPKEGKSTTLANLGVVMAQAGKSVVLVDSDLRRPTLHKIFQVPNREGLTNALLQDTPVLNGQLQETGVENLRILTSGPLPPNPSELLGSKKMQRLLEQLKDQADLVLLDTPPALAVTDAAVLATQTDGVLVVTDAARTRRGAARQAVESLRKVGARLTGVAVNRLSPRGPGRYSYYYYYYSYSQDGTKRRSHRKKPKA